jgi:hypothetical protein
MYSLVIRKISLIFLINFLLLGCTSLNSKFDCRMPNGVMCKSLDQVNSMVDRGEIGRENAATRFTGNQNQSFFIPFPENKVMPDGEPLRYSEKVVRVWITPYEDLNENYHQESYIYVVNRKGHWIGVTPKEVVNE